MDRKNEMEALVVDDNFFNRNLCRIALEHVGFTVVEAENGQEALAVLADRSFRVLVLDLAMPEIDGVGVIKEIHNKPQYEEMQVVVVTAHAHMSINLSDMGADFVLYKPLDIIAFSKLLERIAMPMV